MLAPPTVKKKIYNMDETLPYCQKVYVMKYNNILVSFDAQFKYSI